MRHGGLTMPARTEPITLILADDHTVVRRGIREFLETDGALRVVAEAGDGIQALALALEMKPDVLVLDIQMPGQSGIEVARETRAAGLDIAILMLTAYDDEPYIVSALRAGANGYVLKTAEPEELIEAVRAVHEGQSVLDRKLVPRLMRQISGGAGLAATAASAEALSGRELDVLRLAARGFTNKAIGAQLGISDRTVQGHLASIFDKLNAQSRTDAVMIGLRLGLILADGA
jgi:DNA-binding NarL/FixJ family response regulator